MLTFDDISHAESLINGSASDVTKWNAFFDLPTNGNSFVIATVSGNSVTLLGGNNIHLRDSLFYVNTVQGNTTLVSIVDSSCIISSGTQGFMCCVSLTTISLPLLISDNGHFLYGCTSLTTVDLPKLTNSGIFGFGFCTSLTSINLPSLITTGDYCFYNCTGLYTVNLPFCVNLGSTTGNDYVFGGISGRNITLSVPPALMTCNNGNPDGDIQDFLFNNNSSIISPVISLSFNNITNADLLIGGSSLDVNVWNTFFDLPNNGNPFISVSVSGNTVELFGGEGIFLKDSLFDDAGRYGTNLLSFIDYGSIMSTGYDCFGADNNGGCPNLITVVLPSVATLGNYCFLGCFSLTTVDLPSLIVAGQGSFQQCSSLISINFPSLINIKDYCFYGCTSLININIPACINLGTTTGNNNVFSNINSNIITLTVPSTLMSCDGGLPDGDIVILQGNNTVTVLTNALQISMTFVNTRSLTFFIGNDPSDINAWNTKFNLPTNGNIFTSVIVRGNSVILLGGSNIHLKDNLFNLTLGSNDNGLVSFIDGGCIISAGNNVFGNQNQQKANGSLTTINLSALTTAGNDCFSNCFMNYFPPNSFNAPLLETIGNSCFYYCYNLTSLSLPSLITAGDESFAILNSLTNLDLPKLTTAGTSCISSCSSLTSLSLPSLITAGYRCLYNNTNLTSYDLPKLTSAGSECFSGCVALVNANFPSLTTAGNTCFSYCTGLVNINLPSLTTVWDGFFDSCSSLISINLPLCTTLGSTVGYNGVFNGIIGNTITLTIPSALMTCNDGITTFDPDGDIQYLQANNTVTIIQV